jgi:hypothetical protein
MMIAGDGLDSSFLKNGFSLLDLTGGDGMLEYAVVADGLLGSNFASHFNFDSYKVQL